MADSDYAEFLFLSTRTHMKELETFNDVWFHNNPKEKNSSQNAIEKELSNMYLKQKMGQGCHQGYPTWKKGNWQQMGIQAQKEWHLQSL
jgi:hypothetical protein